jgi:hypothetical protein
MLYKSVLAKYKDYWHKLYVEIAKGKTPEGSLKKINYRVDKKRTSW